MVEKISGVEIVSAAASSKLALTWLSEGKVHIAGSHLEDPKTGEFNLPFHPQAISGRRFQRGYVRALGGRIRHRLRESQARSQDRGSGPQERPVCESRAWIGKPGVVGQAAGESRDGRARGSKATTGSPTGIWRPPIAWSLGEADVCLATRSAAQTFGLDFIPLHSERYDLVMRKRTADLPAVKSFLDVLQRATLRRKLEVLAGYDTSQTGSIVA